MEDGLTHGVNARQMREIAAEAAAAFNSGSHAVPPFTVRHPELTMADAYRITALANEMRGAKGYRPVGRKIGFTNRRIWDEYGVHAPVWGYIYDRTLRDLAAPLPLAPYSEPKIEPEIMFGLASAPSPGMDDAALLACIEWVAHGYEMVQSIFPGWKFAPPDAVIVDGHHAALLIGPRHRIGKDSDEWLRMLTSFEIALFCDGKLMDKGHALNVLEGPLSTIRYVMDLLARDSDNPPLAAGEIISTGTLTRALPVKAGETWTTRLKWIALDGVSLQFC
ncbi:MAG TPA: hydratase [Pseudolabrys sp.]|jgi:2-oxo-3-hexenedioate decarboxylase